MTFFSTSCFSIETLTLWHLFSELQHGPHEAAIKASKSSLYHKLEHGKLTKKRHKAHLYFKLVGTMILHHHAAFHWKLQTFSYQASWLEMSNSTLNHKRLETPAALPSGG